MSFLLLSPVDLMPRRVSAAPLCNPRTSSAEDRLAHSQSHGGTLHAATHAALVYLTIDPALASAAATAFTSQILPRVQGAPGFIAGYSVDPVDGQGFGFLLFETQEQALMATPPATPWLAPGVTILSVDVRRVAVALRATREE
jgi:hypothetical protein